MKTAILITVCLLLTRSVFAQASSSVESVEFEFWHSLRIPYHHVKIKLYKYYGGKEERVKAVIQSSPMNAKRHFQYSKIDTTFFMKKEQLQKIAEMLLDISPSDIFSTNTIGMDGTTCSISFGNYQNFVVYHVWSPDYNTSERRLQPFLDACKAIITAGGLNPEKILQ